MSGEFRILPAQRVQICSFLHMPAISYELGLRLQQYAHDLRVQNLIPDTLIFLQHSPVISMGRRASNNDLLVDEQAIRNLGIDIQKSDRGGQSTIHCPGQLVCYFILNIDSRLRNVRHFISAIEQSVVEYLLKTYDLHSWAEDALPGIWTTQGKIAALGISIKKSCTMHGLALNIDPDMSLFTHIIPCGIRNRPPVSLVQLGIHAQAIEILAEDLAKTLIRNIYENPSTIIKADENYTNQWYSSATQNILPNST